MSAPFTLPEGSTLLGEVVCWSAPAGAEITHGSLTSALAKAGLNDAVVRERLPRHAFARACRKLSEARIIRLLSEDKVRMAFQFTREQKDDDRFDYNFEAILMLDKATGKVHCDIDGLKEAAQDAIDGCMKSYSANDVTQIVQRLFKKQADLFSIRDQGGAYFVPAVHAEFTNQVETFLVALNGGIRRFPIPAGIPSGDRSVKEAVADGLASMIAEHQTAVETFGTDTRDDTLTRSAERLQTLRYKISAYAEYLGDARERLEQHLTDARQALRDKVAALAETADEPVSPEVDARRKEAGRKAAETRKVRSAEAPKTIEEMMISSAEKTLGATIVFAADVA